MISVLFVDDERAILDIGRAFLERHGEFSVTTALSAEEALKIMDEQQYDAVISDFEMPGMNGLDFLKSIREKGNKVPFIIFTGRGREDVVIEALNQGANYYIQKGGDARAQFTELAYKIREAVRRRRDIALSVASGEYDQEREKAVSQIRSLSNLVSELETSGLRPEQANKLENIKTAIRNLLSLYSKNNQ